MPQKKHKPEEIVAKLRQVDVLVSQGQSVAEAVRSISVTQFTYYRWRKEFGGLAEAKIIIESWRRHYNTKRPHSSLGYRPPAPEAIQWPASPSGAAWPATPAVAPRPVMH